MSVERLTSRWPCGMANFPAGKLPEVIDRLAAIEDILGASYDLDRLRELVEADRDGRCVVLPCKANDKLNCDGVKYRADHWNVYLTVFSVDGNMVSLLSVGEAEAALKGEQNENQT